MGMPPATQLPDWEVDDSYTPKSKRRQTKNDHDGLSPQPGMKYMLASGLDRIMPVHKRYWGLRRRSALTVMSLTILAIVILTIGLAVGLTKRNA